MLKLVVSLFQKMLPYKVFEECLFNYIIELFRISTLLICIIFETQNLILYQISTLRILINILSITYFGYAQSKDFSRA